MRDSLFHRTRQHSLRPDRLDSRHLCLRRGARLRIRQRCGSLSCLMLHCRDCRHLRLRFGSVPCLVHLLLCPRRRLHHMLLRLQLCNCLHRRCGLRLLLLSRRGLCPLSLRPRIRRNLHSLCGLRLEQISPLLVSCRRHRSRLPLGLQSRPLQRELLSWCLCPRGRRRVIRCARLGLSLLRHRQHRRCLRPRLHLHRHRYSAHRFGFRHLPRPLLRFRRRLGHRLRVLPCACLRLHPGLLCLGPRPPVFLRICPRLHPRPLPLLRFRPGYCPLCLFSRHERQLLRSHRPRGRGGLRTTCLHLARCRHASRAAATPSHEHAARARLHHRCRRAAPLAPPRLLLILRRQRLGLRPPRRVCLALLIEPHAQKLRPPPTLDTPRRRLHCRRCT